MSYEEFGLKVEAVLREEFYEAEVELKTVIKVNDTNRVGVMVRQAGSKVSPVIYLEGYYEELCKGKDIEEILEDIVSFVEKQGETDKVISDSVNVLSTLSDIKNKIMYKLVNYENNKSYLENKPFVRFKNLAMVFYVLVNNDEKDGIQSAVVSHHLCEMWDVTSKDLMALAMENTPREMPYSFRSMLEVIQGMMPGMSEDDFGEVMSDDREMYVLTNKNGINGASVLLYPNVLQNISERLGGDLIILPSSIHEVIILKYSDLMNTDTLSNMVQEINCTEVSVEEVLANTPYIYKKDIDELLIM